MRRRPCPAAFNVCRPPSPSENSSRSFIKSTRMLATLAGEDSTPGLRSARGGLMPDPLKLQPEPPPMQPMKAEPTRGLCFCQLSPQ